MSAKQAKNHHWLPQSLMRPWEGSDHLVESFSIQPWGLSARRKSTKTLGSKENLHRIEPLEEANCVEDIFSRIEAKFSDAKRKALNQGVQALSFEERENFAFFISLLASRRPEIIESVSAGSAAELHTNIGLESNNVDTQAARRVIEGVGKYVALRALMEFAASLCSNLIGLEWRIIDFSRVPLKLVLADRPLRICGEDSETITRWTIPLGPDHLFVASKLPNPDEIIFAEQFRELLAVRIVREQFRQASKFVVASTREPYLRLAKTTLSAPQPSAPKRTS